MFTGRLMLSKLSSRGILKPSSIQAVFRTQSLSLYTPSLFGGLSRRSYHENVIDHYEKPRNVGSLDTKDGTVGTGLVGAPACGDVMKLQIKVNQDNNKIEKAVFKVRSKG